MKIVLIFSSASLLLFLLACAPAGEESSPSTPPLTLSDGISMPAPETMTQLAEADRAFEADPLAGLRLYESIVARRESAEALLAAGRANLAWQKSLTGLASDDAARFREEKKKLEEWAKANPAKYVYDEPGDVWLYNGWHFQKLLADHGETDLADDAAWELAQLQRPGECEGMIDCRLEREVEPLIAFLERFPQSEHAPRAVMRVNELLAAVVGSTSTAASAVVSAALDRYRAAAADLEPLSRREAEAAISALRK